ncbi:HET-domain-containing protein [Dendrothele bispora CBS 962.96]|uniref:HET-domain-containing protein n=1 Tax=Dendrothele bispora (strain CBS 962.96) TaxID=1314807 RepID=A0A4S8MLW9_DENBC|nr:HET-domain-containing protein [Dendrothele bispora CBS 962.96]
MNSHTFKIIEFKEHDTIPPYAILSHKWIHGEEITLQDFKQSRNRQVSKKGYHKVRRACGKARQDGIRYIWIDTCCIDQTNSDDIAQNIKSMYAYYQNATVCYAYLDDVRSDVDSKTWQCEIEESEWFRRGWTLQELLAPRIVEFYDTEWNYIGSRHGLQEEISYATGIPLPVLSGRLPIHQVDVLERMSWAMGRKTTKLQDQAYCLLGLLGISMDPDYDEDVEESFRRLRIAFVTAYPEHTGTLGSIQGSFLSVLCQIQMQSLEKIAALLSKRRRTDMISLQMNIGLS